MITHIRVTDLLTSGQIRSLYGSAERPVSCRWTWLLGCGWRIGCILAEQRW